VSKVFIYSNQVFVRKGIRCFLETQDDIRISGDAEVPESRTPDAGTEGIDIVILDLAGLSNPTETIRRIRRTMNDARIVVLCAVNTTDFAVDALDAGAAGIMTHSCQPTELRIAMSRVLNGDNYIQPDIAMEIFRELRAKEAQRTEADRLRLTVRESQVINHLMQGKTNRQIGESLSISEKTVKHYVGVLKEKFCVANRLELVLHAQRLSL
jgi:DNA-binding NarL/FixJ family response regulator